MPKLPLCALFLGTVLIITFVALHWVVQPLFYGEQVVQGIRSLYGPFGSVDHWKKFGLPTYVALDPEQLHVYLFNVTNSQEIVRDGMKPILEEVGPYVYIIEKIIEEIPRNDTATIRFKERTIYHFSPLYSGSLSENDLVTVLNVPFVKTVKDLENMARQSSPRDMFPILLLLEQGLETVFVDATVRELLFDGLSQPSLAKVQKLIGGHALQTFQNGKFRFFHHGNQSESKDYVISTRLSPTTSPGGPELDYGQILSYDNATELNYWAKTADGKCNEISGTPDGTLFKPLKIQGMSLSVFKPEICRSVQFHLNGVVRPYDGLIGYRFSLGRELLWDSSINFENNCFCPNPGIEIKTCLPAGTLSNCRDAGVPYITTLPHYLNSPIGGKPYLTQVVGLYPKPTLHESFIDVEPITGLALQSNIKLQLNFELSPSGAHDDLKNVPQVLFPILWTAEVKSMNMVMKQGIQQNIMRPLEIMEYVKWAVLACGTIFIIAGFSICILRRRKKKYPIYFNTMILSSQDSQSVRSLSVKTRKAGSIPLAKRSVSAEAVFSNRTKYVAVTDTPSLKSSVSLGKRLEKAESVL
ncbi:unnamed protein product [Allacma fusca]|uniref:Sensory neuron membrane protein 2 n=1 Tax=Allacma fusca TaxID=39272 RepID=A0A8J2K2X1_9HEXA|nr:unnamed protein product [Allacma fusca]